MSDHGHGSNNEGEGEGELIARKVFIVTMVGTVLFCTAAMIIVFM